MNDVTYAVQHNTTAGLQVSAMLAKVQEWNERADVGCVLLKGTGPKARVCPCTARRQHSCAEQMGVMSRGRNPMQAFCAGGDIKACAMAVRNGEIEGPLEYDRAQTCRNSR